MIIIDIWYFIFIITDIFFILNTRFAYITIFNILFIPVGITFSGISRPWSFINISVGQIVVFVQIDVDILVLQHICFG